MENWKVKNCPAEANVMLKKLDGEEHRVSVFHYIFYLSVILKYGKHKNYV